jgi:hypothetical protein
VGARNTDPPGSKHAVKPFAGGTQAFERWCSDPSDEHESGLYGITQLIVLVMVRAREVRVTAPCGGFDGEDRSDLWAALDLSAWRRPGSM